MWERIHLFVILLLPCQKFVRKVFHNNNNNNNSNNNNNNTNNNNNNNNNGDNGNDNKVEEIILPRIVQYSFLSIV